MHTDCLFLSFVEDEIIDIGLAHLTSVAVGETTSTATSASSACVLRECDAWLSERLEKSGDEEAAIVLSWGPGAHDDEEEEESDMYDDDEGRVVKDWLVRPVSLDADDEFEADEKE